MKARTGQLSSNEVHFGGHFCLDCCHSGNKKHLLALCLDNPPFVASANFGHLNDRYASWRPPCLSEQWTQVDHIAINHQWQAAYKIVDRLEALPWAPTAHLYVHVEDQKLVRALGNAIFRSG